MGFVRRGDGLAWTGRIGAGWWTLPGRSFRIAWLSGFEDAPLGLALVSGDPLGVDPQLHMDATSTWQARPVVRHDWQQADQCPATTSSEGAETLSRLAKTATTVPRTTRNRTLLTPRMPLPRQPDRHKTCRPDFPAPPYSLPGQLAARSSKSGSTAQAAEPGQRGTHPVAKSGPTWSTGSCAAPPADTVPTAPLGAIPAAPRDPSSRPATPAKARSTSNATAAMPSRNARPRPAAHPGPDRRHLAQRPLRPSRGTIADRLRPETARN